MLQGDSAALQARHAAEVQGLQEALEREQQEREGALARLRREQEAERERVKRAIAELKKKLDRRAPRLALCVGHYQFATCLHIHLLFPCLTVQSCILWQQVWLTMRHTPN